MASLDPSTLKEFSNSAAGHEGVLSDPTGDLIIKPCTKAEVEFYEAARASHPGFASYMPTFMGTLALNPDPPKLIADAAAEGAAGTAATLSINDPGPMHGKKLQTGLSIVISNATAGFKRPNILDLKLGARLWDENAKPEKRERLDKVSFESTSGSLGFRIAGMRVWQGAAFEGASSETKLEENQFNGAGYASLDENGYRSYNKLYGRQFNAENVIEGLKEYLLVPSAGITEENAKVVAKLVGKHTKAIQEVLEKEESRMIGASILFAYEGDGETLNKTLAENPELAENIEEAEEDEDEDEDEESSKHPPRILTCKLIDFAHASFVPGQGRDENALQGVRSVAKLWDQILEELSK